MYTSDKESRREEERERERERGREGELEERERESGAKGGNSNSAQCVQECMTCLSELAGRLVTGLKMQTCSKHR